MAATPARRLLCTLNATAGLRHGASMPKLQPRRHLSTEAEPPGTDHHGTRSVDCLPALLNLSTWKEGDLIIISLLGYGLVFYGGYRYLKWNKRREKEEERKRSAEKLHLQ